MTPSNQRDAAEVAQPRLRPSRHRPFRYRGVRKRSWGRWVAEIRVPKSSERLWLGSYASAHQAARAYDVAAVCLRGPGAARNLPMHAVPQPGSNLSPASIRDLAAREAARFTFLDEDRPASREPSFKNSSATSIMQHCSNNSALPPASLAPLAADGHYLQQELLPASDQHIGVPLNSNTELNYHLSSAAEVLDHHQISSKELHSLQEWEPTGIDVHTHVYSSKAAPPLSEPRDANMQHLHSEEAHSGDRSHNGPTSLLDLWFCLDIGPSVHPSLKALLLHSLFPDNRQL